MNEMFELKRKESKQEIKSKEFLNNILSEDKEKDAISYKKEYQEQICDCNGCGSCGAWMSWVCVDSVKDVTEDLLDKAKNFGKMNECPFVGYEGLVCETRSVQKCNQCKVIKLNNL